MAVAFITYGVSPGATSTTCVVTKPSGLAVGNLIGQIYLYIYSKTFFEVNLFY